MWEDVDGEGSALIVGGTMGGGSMGGDGWPAILHHSHFAIRSAWLLYLQRHAKLFKLNSSHSSSHSLFCNTSVLPLTDALSEKRFPKSRNFLVKYS